MKLHSYNILFRIFSFLSDKTNGAPFFVKYKLLLGTLILGLTSGITVKAQKKEEVNDTVFCRDIVPVKVADSKLNVSGNIKTDTLTQTNLLDEVVIERKLSELGVKRVIMCYSVATLNDNLIKSKSPLNLDSIHNVSLDRCFVENLSGIMCYGIVFNPYDNDDIYRRKKSELKFDYYRVTVKPVSPYGDLEAFQKWVQNNIRYTDRMRLDKIRGDVILSFAINKKGKLVDTKVLGKLSKDADKEALRVLSSSKEWIPGMLRMDPVKTTMTIKVSFDYR